MTTLPTLPDDVVTVNYHQDKPFSFGSLSNVQKHYQDQFTPKQVTDQLQKSTAYSRFKPVRKRGASVPIYVYSRRQQVQADICYIDKSDSSKKKNSGMGMVIVFIDVFTKWVWVTPIKTTSAEQVISAFHNDFLPNCHPRPQQIHTDKGTEFNNHAFIQVCREENINLNIGQPKPARKCAVVERFNRTLQNIIHKQMEAYATGGRWVDLLPQALTIYKHRKHRSIGMSPFQAEQTVNQEELLQAHLRRYNKAGLPRKPKHKVDDYVHILENPTNTKMQRGYHPKFTATIFQIAKVFSNLPRARYWVKDLSGNVIKGIAIVEGESPPITWFENELSASNPPKTPPFKIKKIRQQTQDENGEDLYLARWQNYNSDYDEWINETTLDDLEQYLTPNELAQL